jgi:Leucine-rich repeat (LRR) protein
MKSTVKSTITLVLIFISVLWLIEAQSNVNLDKNEYLEQQKVFAPNMTTTLKYTNLQVLDLRGNIAIFSDTRLAQLDLGYNQLQAFNSSWLTGVSSTLKILAVPGNRISRVTFVSLWALESLDLSMNPLVNLQTWTLTNLQKLWIDGCGIRQI